jgi:hypothetical protein
VVFGSGGFWHAPLLQVFLVQALLSSQSSPIVVSHLPAVQALAVEQGFRSSQSVPFGRLVCVQPLAALHPSVVQGSLSSQFTVVPRHTPPEQISPVVHRELSEHCAALLAYAQPVAGTQESSVQTLPSSQSRAVPAVQFPP